MAPMRRTSSGFEITVHQTCCLLLPVGAYRATSTNSVSSLRDTGVFLYRRIDRRARSRCFNAGASGRSRLSIGGQVESGMVESKKAP